MEEPQAQHFHRPLPAVSKTSEHPSPQWHQCQKKLLCPLDLSSCADAEHRMLMVSAPVDVAVEAFQ
ncbi:hypothetical protein MUK42_12977 [Musa troglodytarum]|uniref:Uncharacterized protein n=1 Tax=Musa troglodytarum TaxID=320322 RepID=A0A9E7HDU2_9LILI|nr:hypothetical protein MUK42_12977 [Musa troglodytarum]